VVASISTRVAPARNRWHPEASLRQSLVVQDEPVPIPHEDLHAIEPPPQEHEQVSIERIQPPGAPHQRHQPIVAAAKVHRLGREVHPHARGQRQHRARSSATRRATYSMSVPTETRTSMSDTATIRSAAKDALVTSGELGPAVTSTGTKATSGTARSAFLNRYSQPRKLRTSSPRLEQNSTCDCPERSNALTIVAHSARLFRARMEGASSPATTAGTQQGARYAGRIHRCRCRPAPHGPRDRGDRRLPGRGASRAASPSFGEKYPSPAPEGNMALRGAPLWL
jgi:hypothetical protein